MKIKEVSFPPSTWKMDVYVYQEIKEFEQESIAKFFSNRYGSSVDHYKEWLEEDAGPFVAHISSTKESELKGYTRIVLFHDGSDITIVHELTHALWRYAKLSGCEMNYKSQEWQAILMEYLFKEVQQEEGYNQI